MRAALLALFVLFSVESAAAMRCDANVLQVCDASGCRQNVPTVWLEVDPERGLYRRCDAKGCDERRAAFQVSGIFLIGSTGGAMFKMQRESLAFIDIATLGLIAWTQFGHCRDLQ